VLRDLPLQSVYRSDEDNILEDFYFPALATAIQYDRAVGFFSASTLSYAGQALSHFIKNGGNIRLVLGAFTDVEDIEAVNAGYEQRAISEKIGKQFLEIINSVSDDLFQNRLEALSWLVAHGRLDVKVALRERGMFHDKIGIISDSEGDSIVFAGSANESTYALLPSFNYESINLFPSWKKELEGYYIPHAASFERLWKNKSKGTAVIDLPEAVKERLIGVSRQLTYTPDPEIEAAIASRIRDKVQSSSANKSVGPKVPKELGGHPFKMREHQIAALDAWRSEGDFQGVFDLATGAGKTFTAIYGSVRMAEQVDGLVCVIAVPYQNLADQWVDTLNLFNIFPIKCYVSRDNWYESMRSLAHDMTLGGRKFGAMVVVNRTLKSDDFQQLLKKFDGNKLLWIGDECHHHSTESFAGFLPEHARFRIGLSATPEHYLDEDRNTRLNEYYGKIVSTYSLKRAIEEKVLTPYHYYPHVVELTEEETDEFVALSEEIGRLFARQNQAKKPPSNQHLTALMMARARLLGSAKNKMDSLKAVLTDKAPHPHTLFYCGDGSVETDEQNENDEAVSLRQIEAVSQTLHEIKWSVSRFTARENRHERKRILESFRLGGIDAMVAIKCLDEGIDVPACSTAYILASARDPRQFVQRRGRILRRSPGKDTATIHDFIVVMPEDRQESSSYAKKLIRSELARVAEFASLSLNRAHSYEILEDYLNAYDLEHLI